MPPTTATKRLKIEYSQLQNTPVENIWAAPLESNILEWHYVIKGPKDSPYDGGWYHGILTFPSEYPYKPPSIQMITPNGRFKPKTRLCLSMSDFHPETWNPMWSIGTILLGLYSFMLESLPTFGSIETNDSFKRTCARQSLEYNLSNKQFVELFPDLKEILEEQLKVVALAERSRSNALTSVDSSKQETSWTTLLGVFAAIIAFTWALLQFSL